MKTTVKEVVETHQRLVNDFAERHVDTVVAVADMVAACFGRGGCIYLCGNGGSACDAQHVAGEFVGRFMKNRRALPAVALSADTSVLSCVGNDFGFKYIFARQVEALAQKGDILWAFSTSGASENILLAAEAAKKKSALVIAFTGRLDSPLEKLADICLAIDAPSAGAAQEIGQLAYHIICGLIDKQMFPNG